MKFIESLENSKNIKFWQDFFFLHKFNTELLYASIVFISKKQNIGKSISERIIYDNLIIFKEKLPKIYQRTIS